MSVDFPFFFHNMLGNIEMKVDTTNNHAALTLYFANPSFKNQSLWKSPDNADNVSIVTTLCVSSQRSLRTSIDLFAENA